MKALIAHARPGPRSADCAMRDVAVATQPGEGRRLTATSNLRSLGQGIMRHRLPVAIAACLAACAPAVRTDDGLEQARRNYPPLILGANTTPATGQAPYARACPAGGRIEQRGPAIEYLGADPASPELCRMRIGGASVQGWFGIWLTNWPGADPAHRAMARLIAGRTGDTEAFDVRVAPDFSFHEVLRNEGIEDIRLLGTTYRALKISHYREGAEGNSYRSVSTAWKDLDSGMVVYATYQHIAGAPEIYVPVLPTAIIPRG